MLRASYGNKERKGVLRAGYGSSIKKIFDSTPSFNKPWNTEVLSEWFSGIYFREYANVGAH